MRNNFEFGLRVSKAEERDGRAFLTIYATDTAADLENDSCSEACLESMAKQLSNGDVDLVNTHNDAIEFGTSTSGWVVDAEQFDPKLKGHKALLAEMELDTEFAHARKLFEKAQDPEKASKISFSIGGHLNRDNPERVIWRNGKKVFNDMVLDHITAARKGKEANPRAHIADAVYKTLDMSADDEKVLKALSAPYTVKDLAMKHGLPLGTVEKSLSQAYFEGTTGLGGSTEHEHYFYATLSGEDGTLIGSTGMWSAGERHRHFIDLMDDEATVTAGASRGDDHIHELGIASISQITQENFEKAILDLDDPALAAKLIEGQTMENTTLEQEQLDEATPNTSEVPVEAVSPASEVAEVEGAAPAELVAEPDQAADLSWMAGFRDTMATLFKGSSVEVSDVPKSLDALSSALASDYIEQGGDIDVLAKSAVNLLQKIAGIPIDREDLNVRTAKLFDVVESAGMLKPLETAVEELAPKEAAKTDAAEVEEVIEEELQPKADAEASESPEQPSEETEAMKQEDVQKIIADTTEAVASKLVETLIEGGLLPAAKETDEPATAAEEVSATPKKEDEALVAKEAVEVVEEAAPAKEVSEAADDSKAITDTLESVTKTLSAMNERLASIESAPKGSKAIAGHGGAKSSTFNGAFGLPK